MAQNLELKARVPDLASAREAALELGAVPSAVEQQRDTFFNARYGRLKLREIAGEPAYLIGYRRPDEQAARISEYTLVPVPNPQALKHALSQTLGIWLVVAKRREILLWDHVRIHLDTVEQLGTFVEFEAVLSGPHGNPDRELGDRRLHALREVMAITDRDCVAVAYADLLAASQK